MYIQKNWQGMTLSEAKSMGKEASVIIKPGTVQLSAQSGPLEKDRPTPHTTHSHHTLRLMLIDHRLNVKHGAMKGQDGSLKGLYHGGRKAFLMETQNPEPIKLKKKGIIQFLKVKNLYVKTKITISKVKDK